MKTIRNLVIAGFAASILVAGLAACEKKEGPGERAGKAIDKAADDVGRKVEKAGENIQDAAKGTKK